MQLSQRTLPLAMALRNARMAIPVRGWERVFRLFFHPDRQASFEFESTLFEGTYVGNAERFLDWCVLFYGVYEHQDVSMMRELLLQIDNAVVLDVGANTGHHSIALASVTRHVHAFEPNPPVCAILRQNVARNNNMSITVHPIALGSINGHLGFQPPTTKNAGMGKIDASGPIEVSVRTGDEYLDIIGVREIHMIKIAVEGHELHVLRGLRNTIERDRPILVVEATENWPALKMALPSQYTFFYTSKSGLHKFRGDCKAMNVFCISS